MNLEKFEENLKEIKFKYIYESINGGNNFSSIWTFESIENGSVDTRNVIARLPFIGANDVSDKPIFVGDIVSSHFGVGIIVQNETTYCIKFIDGKYFKTCENENATYLPFDYITSLVNDIEIIGNIYTKPYSN